MPIIPLVIYMLNHKKYEKGKMLRADSCPKYQPI
jgi:hypothetical protein